MPAVHYPLVIIDYRFVIIRLRGTSDEVPCVGVGGDLW